LSKRDTDCELMLQLSVHQVPWYSICVIYNATRFGLRHPVAQLVEALC
jgi:hypothetical protein